MKKPMALILVLALAAASMFIFSGCENSAASGGTASAATTVTASATTASSNSIPFTYFYRGFTPVSAGDTKADELLAATGPQIILTGDDWNSFMGIYCPGIPYDVSVDYTTQCLIADIVQGAKPTCVVSEDIQSISVSNGELNIQSGVNTSAGIYGLAIDGVLHYFLNIVIVNKSDLPLDTAPVKSQIYSAQISEISMFLNDVAYNGFVGLNVYTRPEEVNLFTAFYNGAGIGTTGITGWGDQEQKDVLAATGWPGFQNGPLKLKSADIDTFLMKALGIPLSSVINGMTDAGAGGFLYVKKYDAYYAMHGDTNYAPVTVTDCAVNAAGLYAANYFMTDSPGQKYTVTLRKTDGGYQFVSNVED